MTVILRTLSISLNGFFLASIETFNLLTSLTRFTKFIPVYILRYNRLKVPRFWIFSTPWNLKVTS